MDTPIPRHEEVREALLAILERGLLRIRVYGWNGMSEECAHEADHLHNLPRTLANLSVEEVSGYYKLGRISFLKKATHTLEFEPHWEKLRIVLAEAESGSGRTRSRRFTRGAFGWWLLGTVLLFVAVGAFIICATRVVTGKLETNIALELQKCSDTKPCRIHASTFTSIDWDRAYMFYQASKEQREKLLGTPDTGYKDEVRQFVLMKGASVVYQENEASNFEGPTVNELIFGDDEQRPPPIYSTFSRDAEFIVTPQDGQYGRYYKLMEVR